MDLLQFSDACALITKTPAGKLDSGRPVWVFGAGSFGRDLAAVLRSQNFDVRGFVVTSPQVSTALDFPVVSWKDLAEGDRDAQLVVGIYNRETPFDGLRKLAVDSGFKDIFLPYDYFPQVVDGMGWRFWLDERQTILDAMPRIEAMYQRLGDDVSRESMLNILLFRLGGNLDYAGFMHQDEQYFCDLTLPGLQGRKICYVDAGAYDGDTYLKISEHADVGSAFLFEPDPGNYRKLVDRVRGKAGAVCLPCGLSDHHEILSFKANVGESGQISVDGTEHVLIVALDDLLLNQKVDMIKMDIEGSEAVALKGAARIIKESRPILALSLYHKASDVWELPELVDSLYPDCKLYIRQHHYNSFESVLYALPG